jgi:S-adenosylmethionine-diacylgycerolhomoserine-N-methlytransferase
MTAHPAVGEPAALMNEIYRRQRHLYDATRKFYLLGRDELIANLKPAPGARVLEVACGTGRNLIHAARRYPKAQFYGFDISDEMLATARRAVRTAGLSHRITLARADAAQFDAMALFGVARFDRVFVSYALSMIPPWRQATLSALAAVAPGGELHVVDFGQQSELPRWFHRALAAWLAKFSVTPRDDLQTELTSAATQAGAALLFVPLYRDYARYGVVCRPPPASAR